MTTLLAEKYLIPDCGFPNNVTVAVTTRDSSSDGFNLALHVGDDPCSVEQNRVVLAGDFGWKHSPQWLHQVHGTVVVEAQPDGVERVGDAVWTDRPGMPCAVLTADCLPVVLCNLEGNRVAAVHAGWRGLAAGVLEAAVNAIGEPPGSLCAWLGPAISRGHYEVGSEVKSCFVDSNTETDAAFVPSRPGHWWADLCQLARMQLQRCGVSSVAGGDFCTWDRRWHSCRRDKVRSGRQATVVWFAERSQ